MHYLNMGYAVKTFTLSAGWVNAWLDADTKTSTFNTRAEAELELKLLIDELMEAWENGLLDDAPDADDFKIERVEA